MMRATGVRDAYWVWRRGLDRVKASRDQAIVAVRDRLFVPRLINWWKRELVSLKRGLFAATMEMHCVPRAEVLALSEGCRRPRRERRRGKDAGLSELPLLGQQGLIGRSFEPAQGRKDGPYGLV